MEAAFAPESRRRAVRGTGKLQRGFGRGLVVLEQGFEATVDGAGCRASELLVADGAGELGEVGALGSAAADVGWASRVDDAAHDEIGGQRVCCFEQLAADRAIRRARPCEGS